MITIHKPFDLPFTYPLERIGKLEEILFFDIETTGFSGDYSSLYLIGCTFFCDRQWRLVQWFADTAESEEELLHSFFSFLKNFRILLHFNGDGFDIPYLKKRCARFGLSYDFSGITSIDIYRRIKPYRRLLGLASLKQKAIESFLGISRMDTLSGGELIPIYEKYLSTRSRRLYDLLILHNEDDLKGMPAILPILSYPDFLEHPFRFIRQDIRQTYDPSGVPRQLLELTCQSDYPIPVPFHTQKSLVQCQAQGNQFSIFIELYEGTLKHYYPNYQDYYYLPIEDTAIHKSIGEYVDKKARVKATAKTCYTKKEGCFLPQFSPIWEPAMKKEPKDKLTYVSLSDIDLTEEECFSSYIAQLLQYLCSASV